MISSNWTYVNTLDKKAERSCCFFEFLILLLLRRYVTDRAMYSFSVIPSIILKDGSRRTISKHIHFVELDEQGKTAGAGYAPYLDHRAADETEAAAVLKWAKTQQWLCDRVEDMAKTYAITNLIPAHFAEVKARKEAMLDKTAKAVKDRMTAEIQYWDHRTSELQQKEAAGKVNSKLNSKLASRRADDLTARMRARLTAYALRMIEVKGRQKGAATVTVSKNEMLTALNKPEEFILAIVEVDGAETHTVYLKEPFNGIDRPGFTEVSRNFSIVELVQNAKIVYQE